MQQNPTSLSSAQKPSSSPSPQTKQTTSEQILDAINGNPHGQHDDLMKELFSKFVMEALTKPQKATNSDKNISEKSTNEKKSDKQETTVETLQNKIDKFTDELSSVSSTEQQNELMNNFYTELENKFGREAVNKAVKDHLDNLQNLDLSKKASQYVNASNLASGQVLYDEKNTPEDIKAVLEKQNEAAATKYRT